MANSIQPPFVVKVCGVTTYEDAQAALDAGANALGFNFYPRSPRFVTSNAAASIISKLRGKYLRVGVFVNPSVESMDAAREILDVAQIHGSGTASIPIWRAISAGIVHAPDPGTQAWLVDSFTLHFGGSGTTFDWSLAANIPDRVIVAGGLDADNVGEAIRLARPWGVDSCSRLEASPGKKDQARTASFVRNALAAFQSQAVTL